MMRATAISVVLFAATVGTGCTNLERSRNVSDPAVPGKVLAQQVCSTCHGFDGNSVSPNFPRLSGQTEPYLIEQLTSFRARGRSDPAGFVYMWGLSKNLTDEQIKGLASYFTAQKPAAIKYPTGNASLIGRGKALYDGGLPEKSIPPCTVCHGGDGQGNGQFPRIASQHADYLIKQLGAFRRSANRPDGGVMKTISHDLSGDDIAAVAAYAESIEPK
jgi:cytochrome c553